MKSCALGSLALVSILAGCAADTSAPSESTADALVSTDWSDNVEVQADRLVFSAELRRDAAFVQLLTKIAHYQSVYGPAVRSAPSNLASDVERADWATHNLLEEGVEPVFLIGKRQANAVGPDGSIRAGVKNPNGYLRRATGVSDGPNGEVVVLTSQATLAEANHELERAGMMNVRRTRVDGHDDHWEWGQQYPFTISHIDLSKVLYQKTFGAGLGTIRVGFKDSYLTVRGNLDAQVAGRWVSPRRAHAVLTTELDGQLVLDGNFDSAFGTSTGDIDLYEKSFDITEIGGFPLTLDFEVTGTCDLAANGRVNASAGVRLDGSLRAGGTYLRDEGGFAGVWEPTWPAFTRVGPSLSSQARVEGTCTITATARAHVFDALGPEASASAYLRIEANGSTSGAAGQARAKVFGGVDSRIGGTLRPFGVELANLSGTPFREEWLLFDQPVTLTANP